MTTLIDFLTNRGGSFTARRAAGFYATSHGPPPHWGEDEWWWPFQIQRAHRARLKVEEEMKLDIYVAWTTHCPDEIPFDELAACLREHMPRIEEQVALLTQSDVEGMNRLSNEDEAAEANGTVVPPLREE